MSFSGPVPSAKGSDRYTKVTKGFHVPGPDAGEIHHRALVRQVHSNISLREKYGQLMEACIGGITTNSQARTCMKRLKSSLVVSGLAKGGKSSDGRDIEGFLNVEFEDVEHVKDAASAFRHQTVLAEKILIRVYHLDYRDEDNVEYKMDKNGHLVVSVITPAAEPGKNPLSVTQIDFSPPDPSDFPPK
ncbi:hypothetical protein BDR22DRAFT_886284 [Usnea florida]